MACLLKPEAEETFGCVSRLFSNFKMLSNIFKILSNISKYPVLDAPRLSQSLTPPESSLEICHINCRIICYDKKMQQRGGSLMKKVS